MKNIDFDEIKCHFRGKTLVTSKEFYRFLQSKNSDLKESTFRWYLYSLKESGKIRPLKRGAYEFGEEKTQFEPVIDSKLKKIAKLFSEKYPEIQYCAWSSACLHDFMIHQPTTHFYVFETEKDVSEDCFHLFRAQKINAFLNPDYNQMVNYVTINAGNVVIKPIISRSPLHSKANITYPTAEKILVDIFCDTQIYYFYQGAELETIFETFIEKHQINFSTLMYYAERRKRKSQLSEFLLNTVNIDKTIFE